MQKIKVVLIEENRIMLERLSAVIRAMNDFELVSRFSNASDAMVQIERLLPQLILLNIDLSGIDETMMIQHLMKQSPQSGIICMSQYWNGKNANHVVRAGAKGYIIKPFTGEELLQAMTAFEKQGLSMLSETMTFFSPKGKSGKTTLIANLALALADQTGQTVGIIDADVQFGDMAVFFNLEPESTIVEAVRDAKYLSPVTLNSYFTAVNDKVKVLCGTKRPELAECVRPEDLLEVLMMARSLFRYILIDIPQAFNPISIAVSEAADQVYLVTMLNGTYEIEHMKRALTIFKAWDNCEQKVKTVFTRVEQCDEATRKRLAEKLEYPVSVMLPNAYLLVSTAANNGRMAVDVKPDSALAQSIESLVDCICHKGLGEKLCY